MNGFLSTHASLTSDLSLVLTWLIGIAAVVGGINARQERFNRHCPVMAAGALLNWIPALLVMVPQALEVFQGGGPAGGAPVLPLIGHSLLGSGTQLLMTYTVVRMYWLENLPPKNTLGLMRITIALWMLSLLGGTTVYTVLYVL